MILIRLKVSLRELWLTLVCLYHFVTQEIREFIFVDTVPWDFYEEGEYGER